jgi:hypothetical protein
MALTSKSNIVVPELLVEAVRGAFAGMTALNGSAAAVISNTLGSQRGGDKVEVPYFGTIGELEDVNEGVALTPVNLTQTKEEAIVKRSGKAFETTYWARLAAASDPYEEAARQIVEAVQRRADKALIDVASLAGDDLLVHDVSAIGAGKFSYDVMIDGKMKFGDEQEDIALLAVHSHTYGQMLKLKDGNGRPLLVDPVADGQLPRFTGIPVKVSDRQLEAAGVYTSLILKKGALAFWFNETPRTENDRDVLKDQDLIATHVYWAAHRYTRLPGMTKGGVVAIKHK